MSTINRASANVLQNPSRKGKEVTIATGTLRSHPWHDHSYKRVAKMTALAAPGYLECRTLEGGRYVEKTALVVALPRLRDAMMCDLLAILTPAW
jgi:hypothetical protein